MYHFVYGLDYLQHLLIADLAVSVNVVQLECPLELILHAPSARYTQGAYELFELDGTVVIGVEDSEDIVCKGGRIAVREEGAIYVLELLLG